MTSLNQLRDRFARDEGLPFADVLTEPSIRDVLNQHAVKYRDRVFDPVTTIWGFLSQVLSDDHTCRGTVSRIIAHRAASGLGVCSANTTSYCNARGRLVTGVLRTLARRTAQELQAAAAEHWKWNARDVFIADGSHVSMPDTPENQASYPQPPTQQPGLGFPLARVAVLLSLATGACHDLAIAPYAGKGTGETSLLRQMYGALKPGDVLLADALFDDYFLACELRDQRIDLVARAQYQRVGSQALQSGPDGEILLWQRPNKPHGMTGEQYRRYPKSLLMRQVTVDARDKDNRVERFQVITSILDASIDGGQIGKLYERRWCGEVAVRSGKGGAAYPGMKTYVFSRTLAERSDDGVALIRGDAADFVRDLKVQEGKDICLMGGGELARSLFEAGLIDEIGFNIHPVLLGSGIPLFHPMSRQIDLELLDCRALKNGCVYVTYRVRPPSPQRRRARKPARQRNV